MVRPPARASDRAPRSIGTRDAQPGGSRRRSGTRHPRRGGTWNAGALLRHQPGAGLGRVGPALRPPWQSFLEGASRGRIQRSGPVPIRAMAPVGLQDRHHQSGRRRLSSSQRPHRRATPSGSRPPRADIGRPSPRVSGRPGHAGLPDCLRRPAATVGLQVETLAGSRLWLLPNPSGLQARYGFQEMVAMWDDLRRAAGLPRANAGPP